MTRIERFLKLLLILLLIVVPACSISGCTSMPVTTLTASPSPNPTEIQISETETEPTASPTHTSEITPTSESTTQHESISYQMNVSLNYNEHSLSVYQIIGYTNDTGESLSELPLIVPPSHNEGAFSLLSLEADLDFSSSMEDGVITIRPDLPLEPGQEIKLTLLFQLYPPEGEYAFGYTDRQLLLADWYPFVPPYLEGSGWLINPPGEVGEYLSYPLSTFTVTLQISPPDESLIVAASAPLIEKESNSYYYQATDVRNFSLAISPEYQVVTQNSDLATVKVYLFSEHADLGDRAAELVLQAWERYTALYGENPRQFLSMIEAEISDGLECDGLFYLSDWYFDTADETPENYFELLTVHETSHQWFYGLVHNDQANEPWLDESLATYSEVLFYEVYHPELVQWWWNFRVWNYSPTGDVNGSIYDYSESRPYINATYLRGVTFLQALRDAIGDTAFMAFLSAYTQVDESDFRDSEYFFDTLAQVTDVDVTQIVDAYFK